MATLKTLGQFLVNQIFNDDDDTQLTKKRLHDKLRILAKQDMAAAAPKIEALRALGHELATTEGLSATLDDITPDYDTRNQFLKPLLRKLQSVDDSAKRRDLIRAMQPALMEATKAHPGSFGTLVRSGARGKPVQLMKDVAAPVMALEASGEPVPWLIHHSYAEGLRNSEMWAANQETRNNQIDTRLAVTEPGDLAKILVNNMTDQLVVSEDCGTHNGIMMNSDDPHVVDRYLARGDGGFPSGTLVTAPIATKLRSKRVAQVMVRSPMTCEEHDGVCQKCYGMNQRGQLQSLGANVGVASAQAISEPLTQFALSAKHGVRSTVTDKAKVQGHKGLRQLLDVPENFPNKAALAPIDGRVTKIENAPQGGSFIYIDDEKTYSPPGLPPVVKVDSQVFAGDRLSQGVINPAELVQHKGIGEGRKYLVESLHDVYKSQGLDVDKRHLELLARAHINYVRVDDDPEERFYPGEVVSYNNLLTRLAEDVEDVTPRDAVGRVLAKPVMHYSVGTRVTPVIAGDLRNNKIKTVSISAHLPAVTPIMRPITRNPLMHPDWLGKLGGREIRQSLLSAAAFGESSDIHGTHPIPGLAFGVEFGQKKGPKY